MKSLNRYVQEGFFKNIGADPESIIREWFEGFGKEWWPQVNYHPIKKDSDRYSYSVSYDKNNLCLSFHYYKHKTNRKDLKINILDNWEKCFSLLYEKYKQSKSSHPRMIFNIFPSEFNFINDAIWVHMDAATIQSFVLEENPKKSHKFMFKKIIDS